MTTSRTDLTGGAGSRRLLVVTPSLGRGGAERHAVTMATTLDPGRWRPHVLTLRDGPLRAELEAAGVPVTVAETDRGLRALPGAARAVRAAVADTDPAVVSGHDVLVELAVRAEVRARPRPLLVWKHTYGHVGHRGARDRVVERLSSGLVTTYGAVCHTQVRYLTDQLGLDPRRIRVVPNTVAVPPPPPAPEGPPTVAVVAALRADKGHHSLLRAWATVVADTPGARLLVVGDGPLRGELEALAGDLGLGGSVDLVGEIAEPQAVVARSHALVVASYAVECFPYAALEAMAVGRAVVSTTAGGMPEMVDDEVTGLLVPPGDDAALARALGRVVADPDLAVRLGVAGREAMVRARPLDRWVSAVHAVLDETAASGTSAATATTDATARSTR